MDASNLIKPALANGELRCIGSTTYQEYRGIFEKDHALTRRFQKIDVVEPTVAEDHRDPARACAPSSKSTTASRTRTRRSRPAAELSARHINDRHLPDKAIDVIDEAGARQRLKPIDQRETTVTVEHIEDVVARIARIPPKTVSSSDRDVLRNLERNLKLVIYGQDKAIETLASAIKMARSGLGDQQKPVGSFLFAGPTGVGKTEVTRQLALALGVELVRFDMSEYMERHTVSRLIGAPPGYVGFDQGGLLTEADHQASALRAAARRNREGAPGRVQPAAAGHGPRHADRQQRPQGGFPPRRDRDDDQCRRGGHGPRVDRLRTQDHASDAMEAIKKLFAPEFRNRLDAVVQFEALDERTIQRVVDKLLVEIEAQLETKNVALHIDDDARRLDRQARLRPEDGRTADGARDPGVHQAAARGRAAVRPAGERRACLRQCGRGRPAEGRDAQRRRACIARVSVLSHCRALKSAAEAGKPGVPLPVIPSRDREEGYDRGKEHRNERWVRGA